MTVAARSGEWDFAAWTLGSWVRFLLKAMMLVFVLPRLVLLVYYEDEK
jgi:hypothetical protein